MKKRFMTGIIAMAMTVAMGTTAFAAGWQQNATGWWYQTDDNGNAWHANGWQWVDGNGDGISEYYYFDENGYCLTNTVTPDGNTVNADGAWVLDGVTQTLATGGQTAQNTQAFPQLNGPCYDTAWHHYYYLRTLEDGTLEVFLSDENGTVGDLYLSMKYKGDQRWSDSESDDEYAVMFSHQAWTMEGGVRISMRGHFIRFLEMR